MTTRQVLGITIVALAILWTAPFSQAATDPVLFTEAARQIFLTGLNTEQNIQAGFRKDFTLEKIPKRIELRIAGQTFYRVYLNGQFVFHGPARAAHGYARSDVIDLTEKARSGINELAIEVAGYNEENIFNVGGPSFLIAEVEADGQVIVSTGPDWTGVRLSQRRQMAERFSHARCSNELYDLDGAYVSWRQGTPEATVPVEAVNVPMTYLERGMLPPDFRIVRPPRLLNVSDVLVDPDAPVTQLNALQQPQYLAWLKDHQIEQPAVECSKSKDAGFTGKAEIVGDGRSEMALTELNQDVGMDFDFGALSSAFIGIEFSCDEDVTVDLVHADRMEADGRIDPRTCGSNCVVRLHVKKGHHRFVSFEPYCLRYMRVIVRGAKSFRLHDLFLQEYQYPDLPGGSFLCSDGELNRVYEAGRRTLILNTLDVFLDCPGRERGGWLCDSLWTGRAARMMLDDSRVERAMLENFLLAPQSTETPGYFPSVYPAVRISGANFINTWSMYLVLELEEYYRRTGDKELIDRFAPRIEQLIQGIQRSENKFGLLENLPGFTFLDWSNANHNDYKSPISTGANALYSMTLESAGKLYDRQDWLEKSEAVRKALRAHAIAPDGKFYADALSVNAAGKLERGNRFSEAAQYYIFWLGVGNPQDNARTWRLLLEEHGPAPEKYPADLDLAPANLFIAQYIRFEMLSKMGQYPRLLHEIRQLFPPMIDLGPGTLWENLSIASSVCHGFAAHVGVWLTRDYLGLGIPDAVSKTIDLAPHPCGLKWARGSMAVEEGTVSLRWMLDGPEFQLTAAIPQGYTATLTLPEEVRAWKNVHLNGKPMDWGTATFKNLTGAVTLTVKKQE